MASFDELAQELETLGLEQHDEWAQAGVEREGAADKEVCAVIPEGAFTFSDLKQRKAERRAQRAAERQRQPPEQKEEEPFVVTQKEMAKILAGNPVPKEEKKKKKKKKNQRQRKAMRRQHEQFHGL
nr:uncharacterized protein LOC113824603 [Penaeus vannamei]